MAKAINIYFIWYGAWDTPSSAPNSTFSIMTDLATNIGTSAWYNITTHYYDLVGSVKNWVQLHSVSLKLSVQVNATSTAALSPNDLGNIVGNAITSGSLPSDPNGVYYVLTAPSVQVTGFCSQFCGFHSYLTGNVGGTSVTIKFAFVGDASTQCPSSCNAQSGSPNHNQGADGMASVFAHELSEMASDPQLNAWYDASGEECADKCAWTFGTVTWDATTSSYSNMQIADRKYLIQRNWYRTNQVCALASL